MTKEEKEIYESARDEYNKLAKQEPDKYDRLTFYKAYEMGWNKGAMKQVDFQREQKT